MTVISSYLVIGAKIIDGVEYKLLLFGISLDKFSPILVVIKMISYLFSNNVFTFCSLLAQPSRLKKELGVISLELISEFC